MLYNILFICLGFIMGRAIKKDYKLRGFVGLYSGFVFGMLIYYVLIPLLIFFLRNGYYKYIKSYGFDSVVQQIIEVDIYSYIRTIIYISIGFFTFDFSYKVRTPIRMNRYKSVSKKQIYKERLFYYTKVAELLLFVCIPSLIIYVVGLGGFVNALELAETLRRFDVSISLYTNPIFGFFKIPASFLPICSLLWLYIFRKNRTYFNGLVFYLTFIFSVFYCLIEAGRTKIIIYIFSILYITFRKKVRHIWRWVVLLIPLGLIFIDVLSGIFIYFQTNDISSIRIDDRIFYNVIRQFSYPIRTMLHLPQIMETNQYLFFKNIVLDTIGMLPKIEFDKSYFIITEYFKGINWRSLGGVPSDILSYGYINLSVFGILIITWWMGKLCFWSDNYLQSHLANDSRHFWGIVLAGAVFSIVASADWSTVLYNNCSFTVPIIIFFLDSRKRNKNCDDKEV